MQPRYTHIIKSLNTAAVNLCSQCCLLGNGYVARTACGNDYTSKAVRLGKSPDHADARLFKVVHIL